MGDILEFYGRTPPRTIRATAFDVGGDVQAIVGTYVWFGQTVLFSDIKPGVPKMRIWRTAVEYMKAAKSSMICFSDGESGKFLKRLGWQHAGASDEGEVYKWQP